MKKLSIDKIALNKKGISRFLGSLETDIMEQIWHGGGGTVQEIRERLNKDYSFNTIMTVMNRLVDKELLKKNSKVTPFEYEQSIDKDTFLDQIAKKLLSNMKIDMKSYILAHFADIMDINAKDIKELEKHLSKK